MMCSICNTNHCVTTDKYSPDVCSQCRRTDELDVISMSIRFHLEGHTEECSANMASSCALCTCKKPKKSVMLKR